MKYREDIESLFLNDTMLIDTRSPTEFAKGSFPLAFNLPLMTDEERAAVGLRYHEAGQESAIALGHQLVGGDIKTQRVDSWRRFAEMHPGCALFCFRGGLRSEISQQWLADIGITLPRIAGGYKAMRRLLIDETDAILSNTPILLLAGQTGAAKTRLINEGNRGKPLPAAIDLEGLANHRGSAFGKRITSQPTQIGFENALGIALLKHRARDQSHLLLEDEGRLIGKCALPLTLQSSRQGADWIQLEASLEDRVQHSYENYILDNLTELSAEEENPERAFARFSQDLLDALERIQKRLGGTRYQALLKMMRGALEYHAEGEPKHHKRWIETLLVQYYDPMYAYQMKGRDRPPIFRGNEIEVVDFLRDNF